MEFEEFQKIARLKRECLITEKIDGTNAQIQIVPLALDGVDLTGNWRALVVAANETHVMFAGSRSRYITPTDDNFGFAKFVKANADALWSLGDGRHYGEWWGLGIQRGYGQTEKRFSHWDVRFDEIETDADDHEDDQHSNHSTLCLGVLQRSCREPWATQS